MTSMPTSPTLAQWLRADVGQSIPLTILFTDIVGSTRMNLEIGNPRWIRRLLAHFEKGRKLLEEHDGYKVKFIGDSFMVVFRSPLNALNFAAAFYKNTGHEEIRIRACLHSGFGWVIDNDVFGSMVNYAARILSWQKEAGIVLSEDAYNGWKDDHSRQRAIESFIHYNSVKLRDFGSRRLHRLNFEIDENYRLRIRESVPNIGDVRQVGVAADCHLRQATDDDIAYIADLEFRAYDRGIAVPEPLFRSWYDANPTGFSVLCDDKGVRIGHLDLLPLRPSGVELLHNGELGEQAITPEMIYSAVEQNQTECFYVESIVVDDKYKDLRPRALFGILNCFGKVMSRMSKSTNKKKVYALGGTKSGERLMQQLGFHLITRPEDRADNFGLYVATEEDIRSNIERILKGPQD